MGPVAAVVDTPTTVTRRRYASPTVSVLGQRHPQSNFSVLEPSNVASDAFLDASAVLTI